MKYVWVFTGLVAFAIAIYYFLSNKTGVGADRTIQYELYKSWPALPKNFKLGTPAGMGSDTNQNIVVFHRAGREWPLFGDLPTSLLPDKTILIINKESGELIDSWGANLFVMPHGLTVDAKNNIWVTDVGLHQIFKFTHEGKLLMKVGEAGVPGNDKNHFNKPTDLTIANDGSFYVSDGYGNSRVVKFSPEGEFLLEWGSKGAGPGEFNIPHAVTLDGAGNVYVADRENNRIQVFTFEGKFIREIKDNSFGTIGSIAFDKSFSKLFSRRRSDFCEEQTSRIGCVHF